VGGAYVGDICRTLTHKGSAQLSSGRLQENVWSKIRCNPPCPERSPWTKIPLRGMPQIIFFERDGESASPERSLAPSLEV